VKRFFLCIGLCLALCVAAVPVAAAGVGTANGPQAVAAKKLNKKKLRKRARNYIQGVWTSGFPGGPVYTTVAYCTNGTYGFRVVKQNASGPSDTTFNGSWSVKTAGRSTATVGYTIDNFQSAYIDGSPGPDSFPGSPAILAVRASSFSQASFDGVAFMRGSGSCSDVGPLL
jgi:hypothetical protein